MSVQTLFAVFVVSVLCTSSALRPSNIAEEEHALDEIVIHSASIGQMNPGSQLGRTVQKTVQTGFRNAKLGNAVKGFQFKAKPNGVLRNGFHAPPSHAFGGVRNQFGRGFSNGFGRGFGNGFGMTNGLARGPNGMPGVARRFASGNAQVLPKNVHILGFENLQGGLREPILRAVGRASEHAQPSDIAKSIRESAWHIFKGFTHNDVHVLVSRSEVGIGKAAKDFVGRFKIQKGGKDLYVTIIKRSEWAPPFKVNVNYGGGRSDLDLLRTFGRGLRYVRNIFQSKSLDFMRQKVGEVAQSGLSEAGMAKQLESLIQQKWGRGWNIVVSKTEQQIATNVNDIMANFKVNDIFFTIIRQMV